MTFITIDGDDIGPKLAACYLTNDVQALQEIKTLVEEKTRRIAEVLTNEDFEVFFCAADGVTAFSKTERSDTAYLYNSITIAAGTELAFSVGVGNSLREAYVALLFAKSTGKARLCNFDSMDQ